MQRTSILVVEDEKEYRDIYTKWLSHKGYDVELAKNEEEAVGKLKTGCTGIVLLDLRLPPLNTSKAGLSLIPRIISSNPLAKIIVTTGSDTENTAIEAIEKGAYDFFEKGDSLSKLLIIIERAEKTYRLESHIHSAKEDSKRLYSFDGIIGRSSRMQKLFHVIKNISDSDANILLLGATGTGKDLVAQTIHYNSKRAMRPFIRVTPAAIPYSLLESELFGYKKGSFTGADEDRIGRFQAADKGTVFLDEIGDLPGNVQVKLLRAIQEKSFERLGDNKTINVDVRIMAATNRDLNAMIKEGSFREDLFYRLNTVTIEMPSLKDRKDDIPLLADYFIKQYCEANGKPIKRLSDTVLDAFMLYDWPGNIRELKNAIERSFIFSKGDIINIEDLPINIISDQHIEEDRSQGLKEKIRHIEKMLILENLRISNYNQTKAARLLKISEKNLRDRMKKYGIPSAKKFNST